MANFTERIIGAAKLDNHVYEEVEADTSVTIQAMMVVILSAVSGGIGGISGGGFFVSTIAALIGWLIWAFLTYTIGTRLLAEPQTNADLGQLMRTLGFAQSPGLLRFFGIIPSVGPLFLGIIQIWILVAMVIAVRQALDYTTTGRAVSVCLIGWVASIFIIVIISFVFGPTAS